MDRNVLILGRPVVLFVEAFTVDERGNTKLGPLRATKISIASIVNRSISGKPLNRSSIKFYRINIIGSFY